RGKRGLHALERQFIVVGANNRSTGSGEVRAGAARACGIDHLYLPDGQREDGAADVEILVDEPRQPAGVAVEKHPTRGRGEVGDTPHAIHYVRVAAAEALLRVVMKHLGGLAEPVMVGQIEWRQQRGIERFVLVVPQLVELTLVLRAEVHV